MMPELMSLPDDLSDTPAPLPDDLAALKADNEKLREWIGDVLNYAKTFVPSPATNASIVDMLNDILQGKAP